jgi:molybdate transport system substrate-binding protein
VFATPGATPSGTHMGKLIEQLGIADAMKGRIIHRPALEGGVELVAGGEAELGFYPKSEVISAAGLALVGPLPAAIQLTTIYGAAVTSASDAPDAGKTFIAFMRDDANRAVWTRGGFDPPSPLP